ncbi:MULTISPECIES: methionine ABC transporter permease [Dialister]|jgi:D-methionine transport system permease protein|uniref:methionine ABC transporter permease n=1 Tax=Dialister TaxID=39948 RepID=UPI00033574A3|nr:MULTISPECIES: methionine ABC transporter permease [Dialister]UYJ16229.1 MAG: ABC transporter permease [Veillonellaceae bacterium]MBS6413694.1 ABC transporter permease [Dialister sp.]MCH3912178.1 ABC transporter permease [Dialister sp.]MCH3930066.1 ABC transporter permease [Dialister sp.]MEE1348646.1 methionine ABC transporter permease [Dialister hominis]
MSPVITNLLFKSLAETLYMLSVSAIIAAIIGIPLGILLVVTEKNGILVCPVLNKPLAFAINMVRSIPFIILMVAIIPFTRMVAGTSIGTTAAIVPLTIAAIPYTARMVETSIREIPFGLIEAAESMGASPYQIIKKVLIPEALPSIIENMTVVIVSLIGSSAMAGTIGGGGLGDLAIRYGYQRFQADVMIATIIVLIIIVQLIQFIGSTWSRKTDKR